MSVPPRDDVLVFLDLETTGLDPAQEFILEIGMLIVDAKTLEPYGSEPTFSEVIRPRNGDCPRLDWENPDAPVDMAQLCLASNSVVQEMHEKNGLWADAEDNGIQLSVAFGYAINWLTLQFEDRKGTPWQPVMMAGNGIDRFDRPFIKETHFGRQLDAMFHYRSLDVSAVRQGLKVAGLDVPTVEGSIEHRALEDCKAECMDWQAIVNYLKSLNEWWLGV